MKLNKKLKYKAFLILFLVSLLSSIILLTDTSEICDVGKSCDIVQNSKYASIFGIKNNIYGLGIFTILLFVTSHQIRKPTRKKHNIISMGIVIGAGIAIYFIYLQQFVLNAWCKYCLVVDASLLLALFILLLPENFEVQVQ